MMTLAKRPALIVVDMQNDFVRQGAPMEVPPAREILPRLARVIDAFRAADLPVIYTRYVAAPDYRQLQDRLPWLKLIEAPVRSCKPGHMRRFQDRDTARDAADVVDELTPREGDMVIDKIFFSAFHGTDLDARLRSARIDGLVVTGTLTEMCVEDTARHAVHFGYPTALVRDCVASNVAQAQTATLLAFGTNYGWVLDSAELHAALAERGQAC